MEKKELGYFKLSLIGIQVLLILLLAPLTQEFLIELFQGVIINGFTLGILFILNAYGYYKCWQHQFPKGGHLVSIMALAFQISVPLYIIATLILVIECYLLLTNQIPFHLKHWVHQDKK